MRLVVIGVYDKSVGRPFPPKAIRILIAVWLHQATGRLGLRLVLARAAFCGKGSPQLLNKAPCDWPRF
jgi:hypothetical protein